MPSNTLREKADSYINLYLIKSFIKAYSDMIQALHSTDMQTMQFLIFIITSVVLKINENAEEQKCNV